jgi:hypothetical protein
MTSVHQPYGGVDEQGTSKMQDEKLQCILKALGDAARLVVGFKLITRSAKIWRKRANGSKSKEP